MLVKDINTGSIGSNPSYLTDVNGTLFFAADDGAHGRELWKSDGTAAGTTLVKDIYPAAHGYYALLSRARPQQPDQRQRHAVLRGQRRHWPELWKSDGTAAGTVAGQASPGVDRPAT